MNFTREYAQVADELVDFWQRRSAQPRFERRCVVLGRHLHVVSNEEEVLTAVDISLPLYTIVPASDESPWQLQFVVQATPTPIPAAPADLVQQIVYSGQGSWLMIQLGVWGHAHVDLAAGKATAVLSPELAADPVLVSQCLLNTILLNLAIGQGWGMLHASCLLHEDQVHLFLADHNRGKSTTALRFALAGYRLLSDSMVFVRTTVEGVQVAGFPVGKIKLRADVLFLFPQLRPYLTTEVVRHETKYSINLLDVDEGLVQKTAVTTQKIYLYLLNRHDKRETVREVATETAVWDAVLHNSLFYDRQTVWEANLAQLAPLIAEANLYHLTVGTGQLPLKLA